MPTNDLLPYQLRVVTEKNELDEKIFALMAFLDTPTFMGLPVAEQDRLRAQYALMGRYANILERRIANF